MLIQCFAAFYLQIYDFLYSVCYLASNNEQRKPKYRQILEEICTNCDGWVPIYSDMKTSHKFPPLIQPPIQTKPSE